MTNNQIITQAVKAAFTPAQLQTLAESIFGADKLPAADLAELVAGSFHTFAEWRNLGYCVRRGQHAPITCSLWRYTDRPGKAAAQAAAEAGEDAQPDPHFYLARAHLFHALQVQPLGAN